MLSGLACLTSANQPHDVCHHPQPEPICLYPPSSSVHTCVTLSVWFPDDRFLSRPSPFSIWYLLSSTFQQSTAHLNYYIIHKRTLFSPALYNLHLAKYRLSLRPVESQKAEFLYNMSFSAKITKLKQSLQKLTAGN